MSTVLITGGTGMIGNALSRALADRGHEVIVLSRQKRLSRSGIRDEKKNLTSRIPPHVSLEYAHWNVHEGVIDEVALAKADHIIHLAGASVAEKRWTRQRKQEILDSRVKSGKLIVDSLKNIPNRVRTVISISGIGYYGPDLPAEKDFRETDGPHTDFLAQVCRQWEDTLQPVATMGKRLVIFRAGVVLSTEGGALKEFLKPLKFGLATILGPGKQVMSWIHIDDLVRMFITAIENENYSGVYNAVAPHPVSNKELILALARAKKNFFIPVHVPSLALRMVLGQMSVEVLKSATVSSKKIEKNGFSFHYPDIETALNQLLNKTPGLARGDK